MFFLIKKALGNIDWESILDPLDTNDAWLLLSVLCRTWLINMLRHVDQKKEETYIYNTPEVFNLKKKNLKEASLNLFSRRFI